MTGTLDMADTSPGPGEAAARRRSRRLTAMMGTLGVIGGGGGMFGASVVMVGYPAWFLLWKGGIVREPVHELIYGALLVATTGALLWNKVASNRRT